MAANIAEKQVSKLTAKTERQEATIERLKGKIADMKAKGAARRAAKASPRTATRTAPKRRKATRSAQTSASA